MVASRSSDERGPWVAIGCASVAWASTAAIGPSGVMEASGVTPSGGEDGISSVTAGGVSPARDISAHVPAADRLLGTLVHRMLQRAIDPSAAAEEMTAAARALALDEELAAVEDLDRALADAVATYRAIAARGDVAALLTSGERLHEVPFSLRRAGQLLRGTIDCLVMRPDGSVAVVEFKTGRRRAEHQAQLDVYVEAARGLFPGADVRGVLIYP